MTHKKYIELINKEIDGEISETEQGQLGEYLEKSPDAKELHKDLSNLNEMLQQVETIEPPDNLKKTILNTIPKNKYAATKKKGFWESIFPSRQFGFSLNPALTFAFGLLFGFLTSVFFISKGNLLDTSDLTGSLLINNTISTELKTIEKYKVNVTEVQGWVFLKQADDNILIEVDFDSKKPLELTLAFNEENFAFIGFSRAEANNTPMSVSNGNLKMNTMGQQKSYFLFKHKTAHATPIHFRILDGGRSLFEKHLNANAGEN